MSRIPFLQCHLINGVLGVGSVQVPGGSGMQNSQKTGPRSGLLAALSTMCYKGLRVNYVVRLQMGIFTLSRSMDCAGEPRPCRPAYAPPRRGCLNQPRSLLAHPNSRTRKANPAQHGAASRCMQHGPQLYSYAPTILTTQHRAIFN
jgi:hypothetical protein